MTREEFAWRGRDTLPSWAGFQERSGPYTSQASEEPSDGRVQIDVADISGTDVAEDGPEAAIEPTAEQVAAYQHLKDNEPAVAAAVLNGLLKHYPTLRENYGAEGDPKLARLMPPVSAPEGFRDLIGLGTVHVLPVQKDGVAYVGFEFGCTWDEEHGLGVMTHRGRVIEVGDAEYGFGEFVAEDDGGTMIEPEGE